MKIFLHSVYRGENPQAPSRIDFLHECAQRGARRHALCEDAGAADAIFITEAWRHEDDPFFGKILGSPIVRQHRKKAFVYCDTDLPCRLLPGIYPSVPRRAYDAAYHVPGPYLTPTIKEFEGMPDMAPLLLYGFRGATAAHACRRNICRLHDSRGKVEDVGREWGQKVYSSDRGAMVAAYRQALMESKFVLCPRGKGTSSYRIFEAMAVGRVPVIISDSWSEPPGVNWTKCSVRISEGRIESMPEVLAALEPQWEAMSRAVREAYDQCFATHSLFDWIGDQLASLLNHSRRVALGRRAVSISMCRTAQIREETQYFVKHVMAGMRKKPALRAEAQRTP